MTGRVEGLHNNDCRSRYLLEFFLLIYIRPPRDLSLCALLQLRSCSVFRLNGTAVSGRHE